MQLLPTHFFSCISQPHDAWTMMTSKRADDRPSNHRELSLDVRIDLDGKSWSWIYLDGKSWISWIYLQFWIYLNLMMCCFCSLCILVNSLSSVTRWVLEDQKRITADRLSSYPFFCARLVKNHFNKRINMGQPVSLSDAPKNPGDASCISEVMEMHSPCWKPSGSQGRETLARSRGNLCLCAESATRAARKLSERVKNPRKVVDDARFDSEPTGNMERSTIFTRKTHYKYINCHFQ